MNKFIFTALAILVGGQLQAQTGYGASASKTAATDLQWQNWVFGSVTAVIAGSAVWFLTTETGSKPSQAH
jgi:hypothetical protein